MQVDLDPGDGGADCLAYFLEQAEIAALLPDWPLGMNLVVCLDAEGECELVVYHADEGDVILDRVGEVLNRAPQTFAVSPRIEGWPTRRVLFSEERKLMDLISGAERLCETATDYEINFNFAREEGLDPAEVTRARSVGGLGGLGRPRVRQPDEDPTPEAAPRVRTGQGAAGAAALPSGYLWVGADDATPACDFVSGRILSAGNVIRVAIGPSALEVEVAPVVVARIAFREDFTRFALPRDVLGADWTPGQAVVVDVPVALFPAVLASRFQRRPYSCHITVSDGGVFILPGNAVEAARRPAPAKAPAVSKRPRLVTPVRAAGLALATVGLAAGGLVGALKSTAPATEQVAQLDPAAPAPARAPAESAMQMLAAFAAADR